MKALLILTLFSLCTPWLAQADVESDLDSLGSQKEILERAKKLGSKSRFRIVQKRKVDRRNRLEISVRGGLSALGGDTYYDTYNYGLGVDWHIIPQLSFGVRYNRHSNPLNDEGTRIFEEGRREDSAGRPIQLPTLDYPLQSVVGVVNWYPLYGKFNFFDQRTVQFDFYAVGGAGVMSLSRSENKAIYLSGGGVGIWWHKNISTRFEARYEFYKENNKVHSRNINKLVLSTSLGILF